METLLQEDGYKVLWDEEEQFIDSCEHIAYCSDGYIRECTTSAYSGDPTDGGSMSNISLSEPTWRTRDGSQITPAAMDYWHASGCLAIASSRLEALAAENVNHKRIAYYQCMIAALERRINSQNGYDYF